MIINKEINMNSKHNLEINDLIDSAVNNALERRNEALASVSDEEMKNVSGGAKISSISPIKPIILGYWNPIIFGYREIITIGRIKYPNDIA
jgi:hypothetical protein